MEWDDLRIVLAIARAGSSRGAAAELGVGHATVNRRLAGLERALGTRLFDRSRDGLRSTEAGTAVATAAERVEAEMLRVHREVVGRDTDPRGKLRVSVPYAVLRGFLGEDLRAFARLYPGVDLALDVTDRFTDLRRLEADVSIRMAHEVTDDVVGRRLCRYAKSIYAAPEVAEALAAGHVEDVAWLGWPEPGDAADDGNGWVRDTPWPALATRHDLPSHLMQVEAARAGLGLAMLPCFLGDAEPGLVRVVGAPEIADRHLWLLLRPDIRQTAVTRAFVDLMAVSILARVGSAGPPTTPPTPPTLSRPQAPPA